MMKKVFLSLLLALVGMPALFAQVNAGHTIKIDSVSTCHDYLWVRDSVVYTADTVALYTKGDTTFILNLTIMSSVYDTANAIQLAGTCKATWNSKDWTVTGTFFDTLSTTEGCDSIVKVNVVLTNTDSVQTVVNCGTYTAPWGEEYTESEEIDHTVTDGDCSIRYRISLTVNPTYSGITEEVTAGCFYQWGDTTITDTESHTRTLASVDGCDSVVTLTITEFTGDQYDTISIVACDFYKPEWHDTIFESGLYDNFTTEGTCNMYTTYDVTIVQSISDTADATITEVQGGCSYLWNGDTITDTLPHYHLYTSTIGGCDSLAGISVVFNNRNVIDQYVEYCGESYSWKKDNKNLPGSESQYTYTTDTIVEVEIPDTTTCITVYRLNLTMIHLTDTVQKEIYSCGTQYIYSFYQQDQNGNWKKTGRDTLTASGYHSAKADGTPYIDINSSTKCQTWKTIKLNLNIPEVRYRKDTVRVTACNSYRFKADYYYGDNHTYTSDFSGEVKHEERDQYDHSRCYDSIAYLEVTIKKDQTETSTVRACDSYLWISGNDTIGTYTETGKYRDTLAAPTADGCRQIAELNLTIYQTPSVIIEGEWMLQPGESTVLRAIPTEDSDPINGGYKWFVDGNSTAASTADSLELNNVQKNTEIRLESTAKHGSLGCTAVDWITVTANVGIDAVDQTSVNIYPNPASRFLNIVSEQQLSQINVYNEVGQQVIVRNVEGNSLQLDLNQLPTGSYTLGITAADGSQAVRKFIVNK